MTRSYVSLSSLMRFSKRLDDKRSAAFTLDLGSDGFVMSSFVPVSGSVVIASSQLAAPSMSDKSPGFLSSVARPRASAGKRRSQSTIIEERPICWLVIAIKRAVVDLPSRGKDEVNKTTFGGLSTFEKSRTTASWMSKPTP